MKTLTPFSCELEFKLLTLWRLNILSDSAVEFYKHQVSLSVISGGIHLVVNSITLSESKIDKINVFFSAKIYNKIKSLETHFIKLYKCILRYLIPLCPIMLYLISIQWWHSELKLFLAKSSSRISSLMFDPVGPCENV